MSDTRAVPCYVLIIRKDNRIVRRIVLDSLSDALAAARHDAAWLAGIGSVLVSPLIDVRRRGAEEAWDDVLRGAYYDDERGHWTLEQDGDLFAVVYV